ncbi:pancreatic secretory granule membrane major glycoprotein GP2-like isoform 1-T2 [Anomaloglossus baeobatrachus]|uniref:pancreatic secretory granule membrane major glycoprotein GP2-like n=1 Tax=Anomaloglossus baeobatrachus TaxID=238106 RepID=UPI003F505C66
MYPGMLTLLVLFSASLASSLRIDGVLSEDILSEPRSLCEDTDGLCSNLVCSKDKFSVTLRVPALRLKEIDIPNIHLRDRSCTGFPYDDVKMDLEWSLGPYICGTDFRIINDNGVYKNQIFLPPGGIIYRHQYVINVTCTFPLSYNVSLPEHLRPDVSITYIPIENVGKFEVKMSIYTDISYTTPYTSSEIKLPTTDNLYVGVYIVNPISDYSLLMVNCFSTPTNNFYDPIQYGIIINKCRNPQDSTIVILENGVSTFGKFYIQMFKFVGDYNYVFLHCQVSLCSGSCPPSCYSRAANDDAVQNLGSPLTIGPIRQLSDTGNDCNEPQPDSVGKASGLSLLAMLGFMLINNILL